MMRRSAAGTGCSGESRLFVLSRSLRGGPRGGGLRSWLGSSSSRLLLLLVTTAATTLGAFALELHKVVGAVSNPGPAAVGGGVTALTGCLSFPSCRGAPEHLVPTQRLAEVQAEQVLSRADGDESAYLASSASGGSSAGLEGGRTTPEPEGQSSPLPHLLSGGSRGTNHLFGHLAPPGGQHQALAGGVPIYAKEDPFPSAAAATKAKGPSTSTSSPPHANQITAPSEPDARNRGSKPGLAARERIGSTESMVEEDEQELRREPAAEKVKLRATKAAKPKAGVEVDELGRRKKPEQQGVRAGNRDLGPIPRPRLDEDEDYMAFGDVVGGESVSEEEDVDAESTTRDLFTSEEDESEFPESEDGAPPLPSARAELLDEQSERMPQSEMNKEQEANSEPQQEAHSLYPQRFLNAVLQTGARLRQGFNAPTNQDSAVKGIPKDQVSFLPQRQHRGAPPAQPQGGYVPLATVDDLESDASTSARQSFAPELLHRREQEQELNRRETEDPWAEEKVLSEKQNPNRYHAVELPTAALVGAAAGTVGTANMFIKNGTAGGVVAVDYHDATRTTAASPQSSDAEAFHSPLAYTPVGVGGVGSSPHPAAQHPHPQLQALPQLSKAAVLALAKAPKFAPQSSLLGVQFYDAEHARLLGRAVARQGQPSQLLPQASLLFGGAIGRVNPIGRHERQFLALPGNLDWMAKLEDHSSHELGSVAGEHESSLLLENKSVIPRMRTPAGELDLQQQGATLAANSARYHPSASMEGARTNAELFGKEVRFTLQSLLEEAAMLRVSVADVLGDQVVRKLFFQLAREITRLHFVAPHGFLTPKNVVVGYVGGDEFETLDVQLRFNKPSNWDLPDRVGGEEVATSVFGGDEEASGGAGAAGEGGRGVEEDGYNMAGITWSSSGSGSGGKTKPELDLFYFYLSPESVAWRENYRAPSSGMTQSREPGAANPNAVEQQQQNGQPLQQYSLQMGSALAKEQDDYALGLILFELYRGRKLFSGYGTGNVFDLYEQVRAMTPEQLKRELRAGGSRFKGASSSAAAASASSGGAGGAAVFLNSTSSAAGSTAGGQHGFNQSLSMRSVDIDHGEHVGEHMGSASSPTSGGRATRSRLVPRSAQDLILQLLQPQRRLRLVKAAQILQHPYILRFETCDVPTNPVGTNGNAGGQQPAQPVAANAAANGGYPPQNPNAAANPVVPTSQNKPTPRQQGQPVAQQKVVLGAGSFGRVCKAILFERYPVAVKIMRRKFVPYVVAERLVQAGVDQKGAPITDPRERKAMERDLALSEQEQSNYEKERYLLNMCRANEKDHLETLQREKMEAKLLDDEWVIRVAEEITRSITERSNSNEAAGGGPTGGTQGDQTSNGAGVPAGRGGRATATSNGGGEMTDDSDSEGGGNYDSGISESEDMEEAERLAGHLSGGSEAAPEVISAEEFREKSYTVSLHESFETYDSFFLLTALVPDSVEFEKYFRAHVNSEIRRGKNHDPSQSGQPQRRMIGVSAEPNVLPLPLERTRKYFAQMALALLRYQMTPMGELREKNVLVHRDIKLENMLLSRKRDKVVLIDLGLGAVQPGRRGTVRGEVGTPYYVAPEVLSGEPYSAQCDVWSLGVVLFRLLCNRYPFPGSEAEVVYRKIRKSGPEWPPRASDLVPRDARDLIDRMLTKNPSKRITLDDVLKSEFVARLPKQDYMELGVPRAVSVYKDELQALHLQAEKRRQYLAQLVKLKKEQTEVVLHPLVGSEVVSRGLVSPGDRSSTGGVHVQPQLALVQQQQFAGAPHSGPEELAVQPPFPISENHSLNQQVYQTFNTDTPTTTTSQHFVPASSSAAGMKNLLFPPPQHQLHPASYIHQHAAGPGAGSLTQLRMLGMAPAAGGQPMPASYPYLAATPRVSRESPGGSASQILAVPDTLDQYFQDLHREIGHALYSPPQRDLNLYPSVSRAAAAAGNAGDGESRDLQNDVVVTVTSSAPPTTGVAPVGVGPFVYAQNNYDKYGRPRGLASQELPAGQVGTRREFQV